MTTQRKAIRQGLVALLLNQTAAGGRVYSNRAINLFQIALPAILVWNHVQTERIEIRTVSPREYQRTARFSVVAVAEELAGTPADDALDDLAQAVEVRIKQDQTLTGLAADLRITEVNLDLDEEGSRVLGALEIVVEAVYLDVAPEGDQALVDFEQANVKYDMAPPDGQIDAEDQVELETT